MNESLEPLRSFNATAAALAAVLSRIDQLHAAYVGERGAGRILLNASEALRIELTYNSNAIEGSTLSLRETQLVIEGHAPGGNRPMRELYEARNHDRALRAIEEWAASRPDAQITEADLLAVHSTVLADIDAAWGGRFRAGRVLIAGTRFIPPGSHRFAELIPALLSLAQRPGVHPVLLATELHYNLAAVHPFTDGNGRTARLMMNFALLKRGFPLTVIEFARRAEYLTALDDANMGKLERFALVVAECVEKSMTRLMGG